MSDQRGKGRAQGEVGVAACKLELARALQADPRPVAVQLGRALELAALVDSTNPMLTVALSVTLEVQTSTGSVIQREVKQQPVPIAVASALLLMLTTDLAGAWESAAAFTQQTVLADLHAEGHLAVADAETIRAVNAKKEADGVVRSQRKKDEGN